MVYVFPSQVLIKRTNEPNLDRLFTVTNLSRQDGVGCGSERKKLPYTDQPCRLRRQNPSVLGSWVVHTIRPTSATW